MSFFKFFGEKPTINVDVQISKPEEPTAGSDEQNQPKKESEKDEATKLEEEMCPDYSRDQEEKEECRRPDTPKEKVTIYHLIVLDVSGSMGVIRQKTISGCNECIQSIRYMQEQNPEFEEHLVSIYLFTTCGSRYIRMYEPVKNVAELGYNDYCPLGGTPLFDAIGDTLTNLSGKLGEGVLAYVTIITDGEENCSQRYDLPGVRKMIESLKERGVIFSFIGANIEVDEYAGNLGIQNKMAFVQDDEGTKEMWEKEMRAKLSSMKRFRDSGCDMSFTINENRGNYYSDSSFNGNCPQERNRQERESRNGKNKK